MFFLKIIATFVVLIWWAWPLIKQHTAIAVPSSFDSSSRADIIRMDELVDLGPDWIDLSKPPQPGEIHVTGMSIYLPIGTFKTIVAFRYEAPGANTPVDIELRHHVVRFGADLPIATGERKRYRTTSVGHRNYAFIVEPALECKGIERGDACMIKVFARAPERNVQMLWATLTVMDNGPSIAQRTTP